jgi:uncharacterized alpha-E superfamily protein
MLSRTADHLYWMARYTERAENLARMLDVNYRMSLLRHDADAMRQRWTATLSIVGQLESYGAARGEVDQDAAIDWISQARDNPGSILECLHLARDNAHAVRGTLTSETWETLNATWIEMRRFGQARPPGVDPTDFFEWVKFRSHLSRGVAIGTMLQDEAFHFYRMGTFLERSDNTARLLDVKFHAVHSDFYGAASELDQEYDFYHWSAILRSVSGFEVYRKVYRDVIKPERVAELLILRADMPRSLAASLNELVANLTVVANDHSAETLRRAGKLKAELQYARIDEILATGLHAYLTQFLDRVNELGWRISQDFLVPAG